MTHGFLKREIVAMIGNLGKLYRNTVTVKIENDHTFGPYLEVNLDGLTDSQIVETLCGLVILKNASPADQIAHRANIHVYEYSATGFDCDEWNEDYTLDDWYENHIETAYEVYSRVKDQTSVEFCNDLGFNDEGPGLVEYLSWLAMHNDIICTGPWIDEGVSFLFKNNQ